MIDKEKIKKIHNFRYACKKFDKNKKISEENESIILDSAILSPSSFGLELWDFVVVKSQEAKKEFSKTVVFQNSTKIKDSAFSVIILSKTKEAITNKNYIKNHLRNIKKQNSVVAKAYSFIIVNFLKSLRTDCKINSWAEKQTYIPLANMLTTAASLKIDSAPMEGFNGQKVLEFLEKNNYDIINKKVAVIASFGYSGEKRPLEKTRRKKEDSIFFL